MHEDFKIQEADQYLRHLRDADTRLKFRFALSAFLSAARSALQYALKEARTKPGGQTWYDQQATTDPVVAFLKDKRDTNIHEQPAPINVNVSMIVSVALPTSATLSTVVTDSKTGEQRTIASEPSPRRPLLIDIDTPSPPTMTYVFRDWIGPEDVIALCTRYLGEIRRIVTDGQVHGFLTT